MAWLKGIAKIFKNGKELTQVFKENKENKQQRKHDETMADIDRDMVSLEQFSKEFHNRNNRTGWDAFADGLNRLPRPIITVAILSFFLLAPLNPTYFLEIAKAYELMPPGYWALLSVIIGFYFGGRMQLKAQDFTIKKDAVVAAKELITMKQSFRKLDDELESKESQIYETAALRSAESIPNKVVAQWLKSRESPEPAKQDAEKRAEMAE